MTSKTILELQADGSVKEVEIQLVSQTPYSCNREYKYEDLVNGHGFPQDFWTAKNFLLKNIVFDALNSYDIILMLEPYLNSYNRRGIYRKQPIIFPDEPPLWRLENNSDFRLCLIEEYNLSKFFGK